MLKISLKRLSEFIRIFCHKHKNDRITFSVGGHRGSGNTDRTEDIEYQNGIGTFKPAENTIPSIVKAFDDGASFVEVDIVISQDNQIIVTHSNDLRNHALYDFEGSPFVHKRSADSLQDIKVGPQQNGTIPTLSQVLNTIKSLEAYQTSDFCINIEIKDVKDTISIRPTDMDFFYKSIAESIEETGFDISKIVFSSFVLHDLVKLREFIPRSRLGMLFIEDTEQPQNYYPEKNIPDSYTMNFSPENIREAWEKVQIEFVHPELFSCKDESYALCKSLGLSINFWMMEDAVQSGNEKAIKDAISRSQKHGLKQIGFIADEVSDTLNFVQSL